jgi:hypothetical protein
MGAIDFRPPKCTSAASSAATQAALPTEALFNSFGRVEMPQAGRPRRKKRDFK